MSVEATHDDLVAGLVDRLTAERPDDLWDVAELALAYLNERIEPGMANFVARFDHALGELAEARAEIQRLRSSGLDPIGGGDGSDGEAADTGRSGDSG